MWSRWSKKQRRMSTPRRKRLEQKVRSKKGNGPAGFSDRVEADAEHGSAEAGARAVAGINAKALQGVSMDDKRLKHVEANRALDDPQERADPGVLTDRASSGSRKGPDGPVQEVNRLLNSSSR